MTTSSFVLKRLADDWKLLLAIFAGIAIAATLLAGAPIYVATLERQGINTAIDRADQSFLNIFTAASHITLSRGELDRTEQALGDAIADNIQTIYRGRERFLKTPTFLVGTQKNPFPEGTIPGDESPVSRGYFQYMSNLEDHVTFTQGRMASDSVILEGDIPKLEAVIGVESISAFGVELGHTVHFAPSVSSPTRVAVEIVGFIEPTDPTEEYWQQNPNLYINPAPLEELPDVGVEVDPEEPPMAVFVTQEALVDAVGNAFPGTQVNSNWYVSIGKEDLKTWSKDESRTQIAQMESDVSQAMSGSAVFTGITTMLNRFERRSFFTSVPLLLLLVVMTITVLYYILMMVSYLVTSRETDVALLRSRGVSSWHLARIYGLEGLVITLIAVAIAPFLAAAGIALAGKLPYFEHITLGGFLPVSLGWMPLAVAAGTGLLCLAIYVVPGVVGARSGLIVHRLRSSRPPSAPFFQRYYVDIGLMVIGGLVFWELFSRGQVVSGGLFDHARVNEALLFAPVLLLTVVALLFMRFFPLIVRYFSGESPSLLHLLAAATCSALALTIVVGNLSATGVGYGWVTRVAHLALIWVLYFGTWRSERRYFVIAGLAIQAALIALFIYSDIPSRDEVRHIPTIVLAALVPAQLLFMVFRRLSRVYPVWVSMAIWRMARNPLQYSWLVLLVVMVSGLGVLATTVGGTLDRSYEERILYEVAADVRVTGIPTYFTRGTQSIKERYLDIPGVSAVALALRGDGTVGATTSGSSFRVFAVESNDFPYMSWYRSDFSERPLSQVMGMLKTGVNLPPIELPEGAQTVQVWTQPAENYENMYLWMVLQDSQGVTNTISFGEVEGPGWSLMEANVPDGMRSPLSLISVQIYEPAFGPAGTAGAIMLDDIQVLMNGGADRKILDDFEGRINWTALSTSTISSDTIGVTTQDAKNGQRSGIFIFGKDTDRGIRGFYRSPTGGPVPVVASASFMRRSGLGVGDAVVVNMFGRLVPIRIMDTVYYFPTLSPAGHGFVIADLQYLIQHLNILSPIGSIRPNELLLTQVPGSEEEVYRIAVSLAPQSNYVHDRNKLLESFELDPLITAGWRAMMLVAVFIIIFAAALGYITYLLHFSGQSRMEMGFLQALGLRGRQMTWLLSAEHLVIATIGLVIGTLAGFSMSSIMVSAVAVTEEGAPVIPPFILTTDWVFMGPIYVALITIFVAALLWLARSVARVRLHEMTRLEGE